MRNYDENEMPRAFNDLNFGRGKICRFSHDSKLHFAVFNDNYSLDTGWMNLTFG